MTAWVSPMAVVWEVVRVSIHCPPSAAAPSWTCQVMVQVEVTV
ncbi:hypothetical protein ACFV29_39515 [Streptomyces sp. NPDC059690]